MIGRVGLAAAIFLSLAWQCAAAEVNVADSVRKYRFLAKTARVKHDYATAARDYAVYLHYQPDDVLGNYHLGQMRLKNKDTAGAKQALLQALALDSLHVNSNVLLYGIYVHAQVPDSAARCLERVLLVRPQDVEKRRVLADLYRREGHAPDAIRHYEILADELENPTDVIEMIAVLYEDLGKPQKALTWRARLLRGQRGAGQPADQRDGLETMLRLQLQTGDVATAYQTLRQLARVDTLNRYSYYSRIARLAEQHDDQRMRLRGWEGMVRANPKDLDTVADLVEHYLNTGQVKPAVKWLRRGLAVDGGNAHLQLLRGDILSRRGDETAALAAFELAKADPRWEAVAQQRIWQIRPPETREEKLRKAFFGKKTGEGN